MSPLFQQRCFQHATREAVARCPACGRFFCRECVTEHEDRVLCAGCLKQQAGAPPPRRRGFQRLIRLGTSLAGLAVAWYFFFLIGEGLLQLPTAFHEGTLWHVDWMDR